MDGGGRRSDDVCFSLYPTQKKNGKEEKDIAIQSEEEGKLGAQSVGSHASLLEGTQSFKVKKKRKHPKKSQ